MRDAGSCGAAVGAGANSITLKASRRSAAGARGDGHVMMKNAAPGRINRRLAVVNYSPIIAIVAALFRSDL